jgi:ATP-dependent helicase YprA (DUF1998 family)
MTSNLRSTQSTQQSVFGQSRSLPLTRASNVALGLTHWSPTFRWIRIRVASFVCHQAQAVAQAAGRQSFVVTTGTGSGKSLCFFVPIIDAAIRARVAGDARRTRAIVIYPMNALANSELEEIRKFVGSARQSGADGGDLPAGVVA